MKPAEPRRYVSAKNDSPQSRIHELAYQTGDRVRLSEAGEKACPRMRVRIGTVVKVPDLALGGQSVRVLFDGNKAPSALHFSYVERLEFSER